MPILTGQRPRIFLSCTDPLPRNSPEHFDTWFTKVIYRCTLYKRQIDTCRTCGQVGHRQDVCPTPSTKVCDHCGHLPTDNPHVCNNQCVPYAAKRTARATANADIATSCLTWCAVVVSAVADESKPSRKHPPQHPARFLPRPPNRKDFL
ncbi:hypothetical protein HPB51_024725 [Rhipicephalus microplus]|uniref:CCHC-type domain-containing protein n=1 Tax=Rhipicephalus microplus TaxID=6941 RepID=A0A9J6EV59_RHIMP|nr:hypothetical protein HPB51_024725 [Rhipicephalus microplus]